MPSSCSHFELLFLESNPPYRSHWALWVLYDFILPRGQTQWSGCWLHLPEPEAILFGGEQSAWQTSARCQNVPVDHKIQPFFIYMIYCRTIAVFCLQKPEKWLRTDTASCRFWERRKTHIFLCLKCIFGSSGRIVSQRICFVTISSNCLM